MHCAETKEVLPAKIEKKSNDFFIFNNFFGLSVFLEVQIYNLLSIFCLLMSGKDYFVGVHLIIFYEKR